MIFVADSSELLRDFLQKKGIDGKLLSALKNKENGILVNNEPKTVRYTILPGDVINVKIEDSFEDENKNLCEAKVPFSIQYEDDQMIVCNKPAGTPTHPSLFHFDDSLANGLLLHFHRLGKPFVFRAINRLDSDTSGLVLVAKDRLSAGILSQSLQNGDIKKSYITIACGVPSQQEGIIESFIGRKEKSIIERISKSEPFDGADYAQTSYKVLASENNYSLLYVTLFTGRTHQIRVHMKSIGCPLLGDGLYGCSSKLFPRQALHAYQLTFSHPKTKEAMTIKAPLPFDFIDLIHTLFPIAIHTPPVEDLLSESCDAKCPHEPA